jgi:hypothetical protein
MAGKNGNGKQKDDESFAAILADFADQHGVPVDDEPDASAAAIYLKPHLDQLARIEKAIKPFPEKATTPWAEIEAEVLDPRTGESVNAIGKRFGVKPQHLYNMSRARAWKARRAVLQEIQARMTTAAALMGPASVVNPAKRKLRKEDNEQRFLGLVDRALSVFEVGMEKGTVRINSAKDLDILVRLGKMLHGDADKIIEHRNQITPADLERKMAALAKRMKMGDDRLGGVVVRDAEYEVAGASQDGDGSPRDMGDGGGGPGDAESGEDLSSDDTDSSDDIDDPQGTSDPDSGESQESAIDDPGTTGSDDGGPVGDGSAEGSGSEQTGAAVPAGDEPGEPTDATDDDTPPV